MNYKICLAIPIQTADLAENRHLITSALKSSPNLIELRFDYLRDINLVNENLISGLFELIRPKTQIIATFRDFNEGGHISINAKKKQTILLELIKGKPDFLDIEMKTNSEILGNIIEVANQNKVNLIFSHHNFTETPDLEKILDIIQNFQEQHPISKDSIFKLIFQAQKFEDNFIPFELCNSLEKSNIISFCMGEIGILSRILSVKFGSLWTYGSLSKPTAPGQIRIEKIRKMYQLLFNSD